MRGGIRFAVRVSAVVFALISFLLLNGMLNGAVPLLAGATLLPGFGYLTLCLAQASLRKPKRRAPARHRAEQGSAAAAPIQRQRKPALRVVKGRLSEKPHHAA